MIFQLEILEIECAKNCVLNIQLKFRFLSALLFRLTFVVIGLSCETCVKIVKIVKFHDHCYHLAFFEI